MEGRYAVCRLPSGTTLPALTYPSDGVVSVTATADELSVVCRVEHAPRDATVEAGWRVIAVEGPLDFSLVGVLSSIATPLADAQIPIFVISTFDTDYVLVSDDELLGACRALSRAGHEIVGADVERSAPLN